MTFPEIVALAHTKCWNNDRYRAVVNDFCWDMPGWVNCWSSWTSEQGGMPKWGTGTDHYRSPIVKGTEDYMRMMTGAYHDGFRFMVNSYGNGPGWGNLGDFSEDPIGYKHETMFDQHGMGRLHEGNPRQWDEYWNSERAIDTWPNWKRGYRWAANHVHTTNIMVCADRNFQDERTASYRRWVIGTTLLLNGFVHVQRAYADYLPPTRGECPEFWEWTNDFPSSNYEKRIINGFPLYLRAYQDRHHKTKKRIVLVNPDRRQEVGGVPPQDAVYLKLDELSFQDLVTWNSKLHGLSVDGDGELDLR